MSVHILTLNSASTLERALLSVPDAAEILVIDGGSTDSTLSIAKKYGATIVPQQDGKTGSLSDFAAARNVGLRHTTQPWILILDSDEIISSNLWSELTSIVETATPAAYLLPRKYVMTDGTVIEHATTYPNYHLYFFHRDAAEKWIKPVHERISLKPGTEIRTLHGASLAPLPTVEEYKHKNMRYLRIEAETARTKPASDWFLTRLPRVIRGRLIAILRLLWIWLLPHSGKRLPLEHEWLRFWYAGQLLRMTAPFGKKR